MSHRIAAMQDSGRAAPAPPAAVEWVCRTPLQGLAEVSISRSCSAVVELMTGQRLGVGVRFLLRTSSM